MLDANTTDAAKTTHAGLPVSGYRPQTQQHVSLVNKSKELEEAVLRHLDNLAKIGVTLGLDPRWLAAGRTDIEKGFMAVNRAVFKPSRVTLPSDPKNETTQNPPAKPSTASPAAAPTTGDATLQAAAVAHSADPANQQPQPTAAIGQQPQAPTAAADPVTQNAMSARNADAPKA